MIGLVVPDGLIGTFFDLGEVVVSRDMIETYAQSVGDTSTLESGSSVAPPTFCLALRRGFVPDLKLPVGTFGVYGGHDLEFHQPIVAGGVYQIRSRIADVYEKSGRGGPMALVVREVEIRGVDGILAARISERQVVRRLPTPA